MREDLMSCEPDSTEGQFDWQHWECAEISDEVAESNFDDQILNPDGLDQPDYFARAMGTCADVRSWQGRVRQWIGARRGGAPISPV